MTRLLVLWLLNERPSYGYEIKKAVSDQTMAFWFALDDASIYSALRTLTKHGHIRQTGTEREGQRPKRTRYAITPQGKQYYRQLLTEALATPSLPIAPVDVALAARGDLDATAVSEALARRAKSLDELEALIEAATPGSPSAAIATRNMAIINAEQRWLAELDQSSIT